MANVKLAYAGNVALTITSLNSLASSASTVAQSAAVDNSSNLYLDALVQVKMTMASTAAANDKAAYVFAYGSSDGSTYPDAVTGADTTMTIQSPTQLRLLGTLYYSTTGMTLLSEPMSVASVFGGSLPTKWGIVIENFTGAAVAASPNAVTYLPVYQTVT